MGIVVSTRTSQTNFRNATVTKPWPASKSALTPPAVAIHEGLMFVLFPDQSTNALMTTSFYPNPATGAVGAPVSKQLGDVTKIEDIDVHTTIAPALCDFEGDLHAVFAESRMYLMLYIYDDAVTLWRLVPANLGISEWRRGLIVRVSGTTLLPLAYKQRRRLLICVYSFLHGWGRWRVVARRRDQREHHHSDVVQPRRLRV